MAKYPNIKLTQKGLDMAINADKSKKLIYTHIGIGDGRLANNEDVLTLTAMKSRKIYADIADINNDTQNQVTLETVVSNKVVNEAFYAREIGIYAKLGEMGQEVLYGYANAGDNADYMPDKTQPIDELKLRITLIVGNVDNVTAVINSSIIFITLADCRREIQRHNADPLAHGDFARKKDYYTKPEVDNKIENIATIKVQNRRNSTTGRELSDKVEFYRSYNGQNAPDSYGNVMSIGGDGGSQMFFGWNSDNSTGPVYYRSRRDVENNWNGGWRKLAFSSELDSYVRKSGDTMSGDLNFVENNNTHSSILPSHYFHNLYENNDTIYIHAFPSHPAVARATQFEFRTANGTQGQWTAHKLSSSGFYTPSLMLNGGYIQGGGRDVGDAIEGNGGANVNIASWFGLGFYSTQSKRYTGSMDLRNGDWRTVGAMTATTFWATDWFRAKGDVGFYFQDHGGGWHMSDNDWIRAWGNKHIYTGGKIKADGGFEGKASSAGWADGADYSNRAVRVENDYRNMRFHWSGQGGQPTWLWGGNDGENMYVWNPSNFTVNRANTASRADSAAIADNANNLQNWSLQRILDEIKQRSPQIVILTGEIAHGGTIPLPNGYTEAQCKWMVSVKNDNPNRVTWDPYENNYNLVYSFKCYTEGRKVICKVEHDRDRGDAEHFGIANYMLIGVK